MRVICLILVVIVAVSVTAEKSPQAEFYNVEEAPQLFEKFIKENDRQYKDEADRKEHYDAFVNTLKFINEHNAKKSSFTVGLNRFADFTEDEKKNIAGIRRPPQSQH